MKRVAVATPPSALHWEFLDIELDGEFGRADGEGGPLGVGDFDAALDILAEGGDALTGESNGNTENHRDRPGAMMTSWAWASETNDSSARANTKREAPDRRFFMGSVFVGQQSD